MTIAGDTGIISLRVPPERGEAEREHNPTHFKKAAAAFGRGIAVEVIPHSELKERSRGIKTIVRTGDFTAWGNVLLVSGVGPRWLMER